LYENIISYNSLFKDDVVTAKQLTKEAFLQLFLNFASGGIQDILQN
jgi:hypothetical protein